MKGHVLFGLICIAVILLFTGCLKGEQQSLQQPIDVYDNDNANGEEEDNADNGNKEEKEDTDQVAQVELVNRTLFLLDADGMVVPKTIAIPKDSSKAVARQVLQYLIKDGPITDLLPNGFQAVIPANTEILGVHINEEGTIIVDVSKEFLQYEANEERQLIEAMVNTVTQFDTVKRMKLRIEGEDITEMPVNGTPIASGVSKQFGLNMALASIPAINEAEPITIYVPKQSQTETYFVPVTTYVSNKEVNIYASVMETLLSASQMTTNSLHVFNDGVKLIDVPTELDGILYMTLSKEVLLDTKESTISDEVMEMITRTFTTFDAVQAVNVSVENVSTIKNEQGEQYEKPVTATYFSAKDKL